MFISRKFILLVLAGIIPASLSVIPGIGSWPLFLYNLLLVVLLFIDCVMTPNPKTFRVCRKINDKLSISEWSRMEVIVENPVSSSLKGELRDGVPNSFEIDKEIMKFKLVGGERTSISYRIKPKKRGEYMFSGVHIRITGVLGLCVRTKTLTVSDRLKVYPSLKDMRNRHISLAQKRRLPAGSRKLRQLGIGTEFESIREYTPGDDYRHINWAVTAREGQLYVNRYEPERNQYIYMLMDTSQVMREEMGGITRLDYAVNAALIVAETVLSHGDHIGLIAFDNKIHKLVKAGKGAAHFQRLVENLYNIEVKEQAADYEQVFSTLQKIQNRRSLMLLFTNPINMEHAGDLVKSWRNCAPNHKVVVFSVKNPLLDLAAEKRMNKTEDAITKSAALKLTDDRRRTLSMLEMAGIPALQSNPDAFTLEAVNRYIEIKANRISSHPQR